MDLVVTYLALAACALALGYTAYMIVRHKGKTRWIFGSGFVPLAIMAFAYADSIFKISKWQYAPQAYRPVVIGLFLFIFVLLLLINFLIDSHSGRLR